MSSPRGPFIAEEERSEGYTHVLLITTGSVASVKAPLIVQSLLQVRQTPSHGLMPNPNRAAMIVFTV